MPQIALAFKKKEGEIDLFQIIVARKASREKASLPGVRSGFPDSHWNSRASTDTLTLGDASFLFSYPPRSLAGFCNQERSSWSHVGGQRKYGCHGKYQIGDNTIVAPITRESADELGLEHGQQVTALVKATDVMIMTYDERLASGALPQRDLTLCQAKRGVDRCTRV